MILPDQPPPTPSTGDVWAEVLAAVPMTAKARAICEERRQTGIERYGVPLQRDNSRNARVDAMQELADAVVYLWAAGEEREAREALRFWNDSRRSKRYDLPIQGSHIEPQGVRNLYRLREAQGANVPHHAHDQPVQQEP